MCTQRGAGKRAAHHLLDSLLLSPASLGDVDRELVVMRGRRAAKEGERVRKERGSARGSEWTAERARESDVRGAVLTWRGGR